MKKYKLYWLDGQTEIIEGYDIENRLINIFGIEE